MSWWKIQDMIDSKMESHNYKQGDLFTYLNGKAVQKYTNRQEGRSRMANNTNTLLIWDIDGTLLTCKGSGKRSMTQAFLNMFGVQDGFNGVNMAGRVDRSIVTEACEKHGIFEYDIDAFYKLYSQCLDNDMKYNHKARVLDGVEHILKKTHESIKVL